MIEIGVLAVVLVVGTLLVVAPFVVVAVSGIIEATKNSSVGRKALVEGNVEVEAPALVLPEGGAWSSSRPVFWASS